VKKRRRQVSCVFVIFGEQHNAYDFIAHLSLISILQKKRKTKEKINKYKS